MRSLRNILPALLLAMLAACGGSSPEAPGATETPGVAEPASERGIVVGTRPLANAPVPEARVRLLNQVLGAARGAGTGPGAQAVEVVIRIERVGRDVALVREPGWQVGQRVMFTPGDRPGLILASGGN